MKKKSLLLISQFEHNLNIVNTYIACLQLEFIVFGLEANINNKSSNIFPFTLLYEPDV